MDSKKNHKTNKRRTTNKQQNSKTGSAIQNNEQKNRSTIKPFQISSPSPSCQILNPILLHKPIILPARDHVPIPQSQTEADTVSEKALSTGVTTHEVPGVFKDAIGNEGQGNALANIGGRIHRSRPLLAPPFFCRIVLMRSQVPTYPQPSYPFTHLFLFVHSKRLIFKYSTR